MAPPKTFRVRKDYHAYFELNVFQALEEICYQERKTVNQKLSELVLREVTKEANPLHLAYGDNGNGNGNGKQQQQKQLEQSDLRMWLPRESAFKMAKKYPMMDVNQWKHLAETFAIIATKKRTGFL